MEINQTGLHKDSMLFYCPRCHENHTCARGNCESIHIGSMKGSVFVPFKFLPKTERGKQQFVKNWE